MNVRAEAKAQIIREMICDLQNAVIDFHCLTHAGLCLVCSGGEIWITTKHGSRTIDCPACRGHGKVDCGVDQCNERQCS